MVWSQKFILHNDGRMQQIDKEQLLCTAVHTGGSSFGFDFYTRAEYLLDNENTRDAFSPTTNHIVRGMLCEKLRLKSAPFYSGTMHNTYCCVALLNEFSFK